MVGFFICFYLITGILIAVDNYKADIREFGEGDLNIYKWMPINWFLIILLNVFMEPNNEDNDEEGFSS